MKKELIILLLLVITSFPAINALLQPGGYTSHDLTHHVTRQISMDKLLSEGQFPPRWSGELNNGYGYPVFLFNYPLPALVGEIFHKIGLPAGRQGLGYVDSVKAVLLISMVVSVLGMYLFLKALLGSRMAAFLGAIFYLYAPIRFLNVYVASAVGSTLALSLIPFIFWAIIRKRILSGAIFLAAVILSHNVTALIFAPLILFFACLPARQARKNLMIILLGLGLSAWFWLPALFEKQYIIFDQIYKDFYKDQFVTVWQLLRSPWGYGLSHPQNPEPGDMSYQLGLVHIGVMFILAPGLWVFRSVREFRVIGGFVLITFIVSILLMLKISTPVWENFHLAIIQFPLRFQGVAIFSASIAAALLVKYLPFKKLLVISLLLLVLYANRNHWNVNEKFDPGDDYYLGLKSTSTTYGEHLPKWGRVMDKESPGKLEFIRGFGDIRVIRDKSAEVLVEIEASTAAKMQFNQFYFPGWQIEVDNKPVKFDYLNNGLPQFDIDPGKHLIMARFKNTTDRNLADGISILTGIIVLCRLLMSLSYQAKK